ncbi:MAG: type II secretion system F family protein [Longicatena sp.]
MAIYKYSARDLESKKVSGKMNANDRKELASLLREKGLFLIDCKDVGEKEGNTYKLKLKELSDFSRQIGTMIGSGVSLIRAVSILVQREQNAKIKKILSDIYKKLQQGYTLSAAMEEQGKAFPELMINMYRSGEASGQMEKVANTMALQYEKDHRINSKIKNAMIYPIILIVVTILVIIIVFTWIIPSFSSVFAGMELPFITKFMNGLSVIMLKYWYWIFIGVLCIIAIITSALRVEKIRFKFDRMKLKLPKIGKLLQVIYTARFARTLCSLYTSGVSIINGLLIIQDTIGNKYIESQFIEVIKSVRNGNTLSSSVQKIDGFDSKLSSSIYIGEESGKLDEMLTSLADDFDYDSEMATQKMVTLLEPIMIISLAMVVCLVMLSVLLPIFQMYQNPTGIK